MVKKERAIRQSISLLVSIGLAIVLVFPAVSQALSITRANVIDLTNQARTEHGFTTLVENEKLNKAAQAKAEDMIAKDYWAHFHDGEKPWDWMDRYDYDYLQAGENLAIDFEDATAMQQAWMDSDSHRANLLNSNYREIGVGVATGWFKNHETTIVVQMFGNPRGDLVIDQNTNTKNEVISGVNTSEVSASDKESALLANVKNVLSRFGSGVLSFWDGFRSSSSKLAGWLKASLFPGVSVYAD